MEEKKPLTWSRLENPETPQGNYLVLRRDGSAMEWPNFVLSARDPASAAALRAYAIAAAKFGMNKAYVERIRILAQEFALYCVSFGACYPDRD